MRLIPKTVPEPLSLPRALSLMRAAPVMYEALVKAVDWCHQGHGGFTIKNCGLCKPLLAAIDLARDDP